MANTDREYSFSLMNPYDFRNSTHIELAVLERLETRDKCDGHAYLDNLSNIIRSCLVRMWMIHRDSELPCGLITGAWE